MIELRWLETRGRMDFETVRTLQYRQKEKTWHQFPPSDPRWGSPASSNPTSYSVEEWSDWMDVPTEVVP